MSHKTLRLIALLVLVIAVVLTGCRRSTPIIEVLDTAPSFTDSVSHQTYPVDTAIRPLTLPAASGGDGRLNYTLGPELPPGLSFDSAARTLTGTPEMEGVFDLRYRVEDADDNTAAADSDTLHFTVTVVPQASVATVVSSVRSGSADGTLTFESLPEASAGPGIAGVTGNQVVTNGGAFFLEVAAERPAAKLLVAMFLPNAEGGLEQSPGHYEIDLQDSAALSHRLVGQVTFDLDPELQSFCLAIAAVDDTGAVGPPTCHEVFVVGVPGGDLQVTVSWDTDADLDLHVVDPNGDEIYYGRPAVESGGVYHLDSDCGPDRFIRNEHIGWSQGTPPPGIYEVRVDYWENCDAPETNYIVNVYNRGHVSTFSGTFTGPGDEGGRGSGRVITQFEIPGGKPRPPVVTDIVSTYRGGDQVFVLNPDGEVLDDTLYTLHLGNASAEVYLIATNTAHYRMEPRIERLDLLEAAAKGLRAAHTEHQQQSRPPMTAATDHRPWVTEFNNNPPLDAGLTDDRRRAQQQEPRQPVAAGDTVAFLDLDEDDNLVEIPSTARSVVTDGVTTVAVWVADADWGSACGGGTDAVPTGRAAHVVTKDCVTQQMTDAVADQFLRPGAGNDIYDWVSNIFGAPWGPHSHPLGIPPEAAGEIHILLFDIDGDGTPQPGESRFVGFFAGWNNFLRLPDHPRLGDLLKASNERLMFFIDSPWLAKPEGPTWEVTDRYPSSAIDTLAHEYQHMIHFYQKPILRGAASERWLNEQSSEVAEDLIGDKLMSRGPRAVAHDDPTAGEAGNGGDRLSRYNLYNDIQVTSWDGLLANYSINYAFGAYLARNYGGAGLYGAIVQSDRSGVDAIEGALRELGHDASFADLLANWAAASVLSDSTAAAVPYRYNAGTWSTSQSADGTTYRLGSINLFNYVYGPPRVPAKLAYEGPYLYSLHGFNEREQPAHSNMYAFLGRNSGTIRLNVSAVTDNRITVVVKE